MWYYYFNFGIQFFVYSKTIDNKNFQTVRTFGRHVDGGGAKGVADPLVYPEWELLYLPKYSRKGIEEVNPPLHGVEKYPISLYTCRIHMPDSRRKKLFQKFQMPKVLWYLAKNVYLKHPCLPLQKKSFSYEYATELSPLHKQSERRLFIFFHNFNWYRVKSTIVNSST